MEDCPVCGRYLWSDPSAGCVCGWRERTVCSSEEE
jgi:hypothetical protein